MAEVAIRPYRPTDLEACRALWVELVQRHREIYQDPSIGGDDPGLYFDRHLAQVGAERIWVAECAGAVADTGFGEFRRQMEYKAAWYGVGKRAGSTPPASGARRAGA
jgi:hypothetical protein